MALPIRRVSLAALLVLAWLLVVTFLRSTASAQADGTDLTEGGFNVDLARGPVLGTGQITGMGGAFTALSTGIDAAAWNPAAYASRTHWGIDWFDWDLSLTANPGTVGSVDFDNNGREDAWRSDTTMSEGEEQRFQYAAVGLGLQFGAFGVGALWLVETYQIDLGEAGTTRIDLATGHMGVGYHVADGQFVIGGGVRTAILTIDAPQGDVATGTQRQTELVNFVGGSLEVGGLLRLVGRPWRLGAALRLPVVSTLSEDAGMPPPVDGVSALPKQVRLPWEAQFGVAWQFGERPLNLRWDNPHEVAERLRAALEARQRERTLRQWQLEQRDAGVTQAARTQVHDLERTPTDQEWWQREYAFRAQEWGNYLKEVATAARRRQLVVDTLSRDYLLLSGEVVLVGATDNGVGVESFLSGVRETSGANITVGFRVGAEMEPVAHWLKVRGGMYLEPSRYADQGYRAHGTLGFDVRLFTWDVFGLLDPFVLRTGAALDAAERYTTFNITLGVWH